MINNENLFSEIHMQTVHISSLLIDVYQLELFDKVKNQNKIHLSHVSFQVKSF